MLAVLTAFRSWNTEIAGRKVVLHTDNTAVFYEVIDEGQSNDTVAGSEAVMCTAGYRAHTPLGADKREPGR